MADITKCAKCGACTSVCPVYQYSGQESLTARGRIHLLSKLINKNQTSQRFSEIFSKCLLCGACYQACPRNIDTPAIIIQAREERKNFRSFLNFKKFLLQKSLSHPEILATIKKSSNLLADILPKESGLRLKLAIFTDPAKKQTSSFTQLLQSEKIAPTQPPKAAYFVGCLANFLQQNIAVASVKCLKDLCATETIAPLDQTCCGMAASAAGRKKDAIFLAKKNISAFNKPPCRDLEIFTSCATCYSHLKSYPALLANEEKWQVRAKNFADRVCEFSSYLLKSKTPDVLPRMTTQKELRVFYHDPCHLRFPQAGETKIVSEPRELLSIAPGLSLTELPQGPQCCGQGGLFNISHPNTSKQICRKLLTDCYAANIQVITTTCSGCLIQIREGLAHNNSKIKAVHLATLLRQDNN